MSTPTKIEQQLQMIESLCNEVREQYGPKKRESDSGHQDSEKVAPQLDNTFKDVVKLIKSRRDNGLINGGY